MKNFNGVVVDLETTGFSPFRGDRVIEVGAVAIEHGEITGEYSTLVQAPRPIPAQATRLHGITAGMLIGQPGPEVIFPALRDFLGDRTIVAHNAAFDLPFLQHEFRRLGLSLLNRHVCTLELSRRCLPDLENHRLPTVARHLFGDLPEGMKLHRALDDARLTARVWLAMGG